MSFRGSFMRFSHSHSMRKPTLDGDLVDGFMAGNEILCFLWLEKSISSPPLQTRQFMRADKRLG